MKQNMYIMFCFGLLIQRQALQKNESKGDAAASGFTFPGKHVKEPEIRDWSTDCFPVQMKPAESFQKRTFRLKLVINRQMSF